MKFVIVLPDGVGIRNFLCTAFIDHLREQGEVVLWHALPESSVSTLQARLGDEVRWEKLPAFRERLPERLFRVAKVDAQIYWHYERDAGDAVMLSRRPLFASKFYLRSWLFQKAAAGLSRLTGTEAGTKWLHRRHERATQRASYLAAFEDFLRRERPDVVFGTHQRASRAVPAFVAARRLGIPSATFIASWDNLPKGRMAVHADHFLVWSDYMKEEMAWYYPDVSQDHVHVVGTPQFEPYFDMDLVEDRMAFLSRLGLDPGRPVICFSGDDVTTSPFDPQYLADLAEALRAVPVGERPQILFRRCPVDTGERYGDVLRAYPEIVVSDPLWRHADDSWERVMPTPEDVALLSNVVAHCDLVVNVGSTMAIDFAILGKPAVYLNYNVPEAEGKWDINWIYRLPHFRPVHALQPVHWVDARADLGEVVQEALLRPKAKQEERTRWVAHVARLPLAEASARCAAVLTQVAGRAHRFRQERSVPA